MEPSKGKILPAPATPILPPHTEGVLPFHSRPMRHVSEVGGGVLGPEWWEDNGADMGGGGYQDFGGPFGPGGLGAPGSGIGGSTGPGSGDVFPNLGPPGGVKSLQVPEWLLHLGGTPGSGRMSRWEFLKLHPDPNTWKPDDLKGLSPWDLIELLTDPRFAAILFALLGIIFKVDFTEGMTWMLAIQAGWDLGNSTQREADEFTLSAWRVEMAGFMIEFNGWVDRWDTPPRGWGLSQWHDYVQTQLNDIYEKMMGWEIQRYLAERRLGYPQVDPPDPMRYRCTLFPC